MTGGSLRRSAGATAPSLSIVADHLVQRGGAERVLLALLEHYQQAQLHTTFFEPRATHSGFDPERITTSPLNAFGALRHRHRHLLPVFPALARSMHTSTDVTLCMSAGWSHCARVEGRKVVYWFSPARWLYDPSPYLAGMSSTTRVGLAALAPAMKALDKRPIRHDPDTTHLAISTHIAQRVRRSYGIDAEVIGAPTTLDECGPSQAIHGLEPGFHLVVSRLISYKNVEVAVDAFRRLPNERLVIAGTGPEFDRLKAIAPPNVELLGSVTEAELRWLYAEAASLVAISYEDFGLTPIEASLFGTPSIVLRYGGYLDTVTEMATGLFVDDLNPQTLARTIEAGTATDWDERLIQKSALEFTMENFVRRLGPHLGIGSDRETA